MEEDFLFCSAVHVAKKNLKKKNQKKQDETQVKKTNCTFC